MKTITFFGVVLEGLRTGHRPWKSMYSVASQPVNLKRIRIVQKRYWKTFCSPDYRMAQLIPSIGPENRCQS